jgi:glycosyltransferase involved in cell wall biosynthesis
MRLAVQCHNFVPGASAGIEHFCYGVLRGLDDVTENVRIHVSIAAGSRRDWPDAIRGAANIELHEIQGTAALGGGTGARASILRATKRAVKHTSLGRAVARQANLASERRYLADLRPDVVYYPYHRSDQLGSPSVVTAHDLRVAQAGFADKAELARLEHNLRRAAVVATSWRHPYQQLLERFSWLQGRIVQIPIPPLVQPQPISGKRRRGSPPVLLYAASTGRHKNHVSLVRALSLVRARRPVQLICTGPTVEPTYTDIRREVARLGLEAVVTFTGFVCDEELAGWYRCADAVVAPTLWEAASGNVLEAFCYGLPVACSDIAPLRSMVSELGGNVKFFDPHNAGDIANSIEKILDDPAPYVDGSAKAAETLAQRTWQETAHSYAAVFERVAHNSGFLA